MKEKNYTETKHRVLSLIGSCYLPIFWLLLVGLDIAYRYLYQISGIHDWRNNTALYFTMLWALLFCGILFVLPCVLRRIMLVVLTAAQCILLLVHSSMYKIFGTVFSFADVAYAGEGAKFFSLAYLSFRKGLLICVAAAVMCALVFAVIMPKRNYRWMIRIPVSILMIAGALFGIYRLDRMIVEKDDAQTFSWDAVVDDNTDSAVYASFSDVNRCFYMVGSYQYLFRSFTVTYGLEDALRNGEVYAKLDEYYANNEKKNHPANEMTGVCKDKNMMLILLESIDTWLLTEEYMPNLYRLQQESVNFENHYAPMFISAATFGSEFMVNTGLVPPTNGINNRAYSTYSFPYSLANLFEEKGYTANSFHSSSPDIYSRGIIHENWGFEKYHSYTDMGMEDYQLDSQMIYGYDLMTAPDKFFDFILTYSGHGPYTEELDNISQPHWDKVYSVVDPQNIPAKGKDLEEYYRAVAHAMETDAFIGELIDSMEADGRLEDTVLVFFTDHYCKYMTNTELVMEMKGAENADMLTKVPFFIYDKDIPAQTISKPTSTIDIAPTIANLFDLNVNYAYYTGDDIFGSQDAYVIFRNMNWYDGKTYYSQDYTGEMTEEIKARNQEVNERINRSWDTFKSNYFAHIAEQEETK